MLAAALGHLSILVPPLLLPLGLAAGMPGLAFAALILLAPLLRGVFGDAHDGPPEWSEGFAMLLHALPVACALAFFAAVAIALRMLHQESPSISALAWFGASLWAAFLFASCVAHELVHRKDAFSRGVGRALAGLIGYPFLEHEHRAHHLHNGDVIAAECPRRDESVWAFTGRRLARVLATTREGETVMAMRHGRRWGSALATPLAALLATAASFAWAAGTAGLVAYLLVAIAVAWGIQAITYIQHWGLAGEDAQGWEDHCRLQCWLTLGISLHQAHHRASSVPYYRLAPTPHAPKAPAGYVVLFFASLVPPVWRALMVPALRRWRRAPHAQRTAGRALVCLRWKDG